MPKQKITRDMVVEAAFELAREGGMQALLVKSIASRLGCSVQPIYSYCQSVDALRGEVCRRANAFVQAYVAERIDPQDMFSSTGRAYLQLATEEPHLLRIFVMQERPGVASLEDLYRTQTDPRVAAGIARRLGIGEQRARQLHLNMMIYTVGLGTILSVAKPGIPAWQMQAQQELAYSAFVQAAIEEEERQ